MLESSVPCLALLSFHELLHQLSNCSHCLPCFPLTKSFELDVLAIWISQYLHSGYLFIILAPFCLIEPMNKILFPPYKSLAFSKH